MSVEYCLEKYLKEKGIDSSKVDEDLFNTVVSRIEDDVDNYVREEFDKFADDWAHEILQELDEHPEWKLDAKGKLNETEKKHG